MIAESFAHVTYIERGEQRTYLLHGSQEAIAEQARASVLDALKYTSHITEITVRPVNPASLWAVDAARGPGS